MLTQVKAALKNRLGKKLPIRTTTDGPHQHTLTIGKQATFTVEAKDTYLRKVTPLLALHPHPPGRPWLLLLPYVTQEVGEELRRQGLCYADAAGNAWLHHPDADLFVLIQGQPKPKKSKPEADPAHGRAFRKSGLRVLFHLLTEPELFRQPYRAIATRTDTPVATVGLVMRDLIQQGYLLDEEPRQLLRFDKLVRRWVEGYGDTLRPRLSTQRYRWATPDAATGGWQQLPLGADTYWGGEPAAALLLDGYLLPEFFTLYSTATRPALMRQLRLVPDPTGPVEVLAPFDDRLNFTNPTSPCVPPLLVYADLLLSGDARNREVAEKLYARYIHHPA
ncbi:type IV toxin-antitoxin system AbiEi family antitoxin [Hymenobacter profundi]|uniref:MarR family transcriptional regulator n=1 Tax=Hymenobacter profundi TaxID=1982110 RepID=A0ABS6WUP0_9BACT|nr:type IV toxin-antitoxin system AbiEi family antitoxin [Hymenobacter profundi]MBW3127291.1 hypothetical protein [Hymenobacter profundi]